MAQNIVKDLNGGTTSVPRGTNTAITTEKKTSGSSGRSGGRTAGGSSGTPIIKTMPQTTINAGVGNTDTGIGETFTPPTTNNVVVNNDTGTTGKITNPTDYYSQLMDAFNSYSSQARDSAIQAILDNLSAVKGTYQNQINQVISEYDSLVDQNEVAKERARRVIKERQANRGQLGSGLGRQEQLDLDIGYDNATADLKLAKEQAINEIYNLIAQAEAEANTNKANVNNTYNQALLEYMANQ